MYVCACAYVCVCVCACVCVCVCVRDHTVGSVFMFYLFRIRGWCVDDNAYVLHVARVNVYVCMYMRMYMEYYCLHMLSIGSQKM